MTEAPRPPAEPDLPDELDAWEPGELRAARLDCVLLDGVDLQEARAHSVRIVESRLARVDLGAAALTGAELRDVVVEEGSWAGAKADGATLRRVDLRGVRLTGADFGGAKLEDVVFEDCRLDLASFRFARLERVAFRRCKLDEADFTAAQLGSVLFEESSLVAAEFAVGELERTELRGCDLEGLHGPEGLRGARMPWGDVVAAAGALAAALGIAVVD